MRSLGALLVLACASTATAGVFSGLGFLQGDSASWALDLSEDGTTVIGQGAIGTTTPHHWRWTVAGGMQSLGTVTGFNDESRPGGVSRDGSVITGFLVSNDSGSVIPYRWTPSSGIAPLDNGFVSAPTGVTGDGLTAFGSDALGGAFRFTDSGGRQSLGPLLGSPHGPAGHSIALAGTFDGSVIVGDADAISQVNPPIHVFTPCRWTAADGMQAMLSNGQLVSGAATDISSEGAVIVGTQGATFFRWTQTAGYLLITPLSPVHDNFTVRISGDGSTIIGLDTYWTAATGPLRLTDVLTSAGCDFSGWSITGATGISYDGRTLCGEGIDPAGRREAWIATVPSPGAAVPLLGLLAWRRRR